MKKFNDNDRVTMTASSACQPGELINFDSNFQIELAPASICLPLTSGRKFPFYAFENRRKTKLFLPPSRFDR
jgi:hypothetical protein